MSDDLKRIPDNKGNDPADLEELLERELPTEDDLVRLLRDETSRRDELMDLIGQAGGEKDKGRLYEFLLKRVDVILADKKAQRDLALLNICHLLRDLVPSFDWVGFYLVDPKADRELVLGPFAGKPTDHKRIPFGKGICGQAAVTLEPFIVQDVTQEGNYLSCSSDVKSEIVLPVMKKDTFVAELDIDSHLLAPFDDKDRKFLEAVCEKVEKLF